MEPTSLHRVDAGHLGACRNAATAEVGGEQAEHDAHQAPEPREKDPRAFRIFWGAYLGLWIVLVSLVVTHCAAR